MSSLVEALGDRAIGTVEEVSTSGITVLLDPDAPQATAINTGVPAGFPRINGYLLIPNEGGATVGVITKVEVARLPYPKRRGMQDFGLVDLPFPARKVSLTPLGTLLAKPGSTGGQLAFEVRRGVDVFPSVGDPALLPTDGQLRAIVEGEGAELLRRVLLGTCPTAAGAPVHVDPDKLFGRHLAVLGNTGAGKSCSVAGLIRWSIDAAREAKTGAGRNGEPNARFIVLDPNGEYARAFEGINVRLFQVTPQKGASPLNVPAWLWNGEEWAAFTGAAPGVQRPILFTALRRLRAQMGTPDSFEGTVAATVNPYRDTFRVAHSNREYLRFPGMKNVTIALESAHQELSKLAERAKVEGHHHADQIGDAADACETAADAGRDGQYYNAIDSTLIQRVLTTLDQVAASFGLPKSSEVSEDLPVPFEPDDLPRYVKALAALMPGRDLAQFVDTLNLRINSLLGGHLASILRPRDSSRITLERWLTDHVGADQALNGPITIVDLSLVPSEVIHIVVAVLARMVFEAVQRYRRTHAEVLPTVLVLEEAHTFVHRDLTKDGAPPAGRACCRTFERIAREGRKFGLGLVLASQRPSEMSGTVLSQCNTFLLHRIVNDRDQDLVRRLVPDALGDLLRELPSLPTRRAILVGWGAPAPVLVEVRELPKKQRPHSPDPDFWDVWTGNRPCHVEWKEIADSWGEHTGEPRDETKNGPERSENRVGQRER
jgi:hypothetical protein